MAPTLKSATASLLVLALTSQLACSGGSEAPQSVTKSSTTPDQSADTSPAKPDKAGGRGGLAADGKDADVGEKPNTSNWAQTQKSQGPESVSPPKPNAKIPKIQNAPTGKKVQRRNNLLGELEKAADQASKDTQEAMEKAAKGVKKLAPTGDFDEDTHMRFADLKQLYDAAVEAVTAFEADNKNTGKWQHATDKVDEAKSSTQSFKEEFQTYPGVNGQLRSLTRMQKQLAAKKP